MPKCPIVRSNMRSVIFEAGVGLTERDFVEFTKAMETIDTLPFPVPAS